MGEAKSSHAPHAKIRDDGSQGPINLRQDFCGMGSTSDAGLTHDERPGDPTC
jgi:hypothetical protein